MKNKAMELALLKAGSKKALKITINQWKELKILLATREQNRKKMRAYLAVVIKKISEGRPMLANSTVRAIRGSQKSENKKFGYRASGAPQF
ncbi:MAG: hypothetical protein U5L98_09075 [Halomonas sp.]|uniref:hypothetical protein n=1 Tax=Halomonas sp. TaxID=1486246 RepID=UPI002ACE48AC|nr:hypothetical protein [Halomonas sp.]MDZ7852776.1 hypothetical protein [Halomonas sp.]